MFSEVQIDEFIELFEKEFGLRISKEQAEIYALQFINLLVATYKD